MRLRIEAGMRVVEMEADAISPEVMVVMVRDLWADTAEIKMGPAFGPQVLEREEVTS